MIAGEHGAAERAAERPAERGDHDRDVGSLRSTFSAMSPAMFATMRESEEDPPLRGLAELIAAASARVPESAPRSWWQRLAVPLRQPPILAVTSIAILIGGAFAIWRPGAVPAPAAPDVPPAARHLQQMSDDAASAAIRGDCATVRALATRLARQAPAYYRDHVATVADVARCLLH